MKRFLREHGMAFVLSLTAVMVFSFLLVFVQMALAGDSPAEKKGAALSICPKTKIADNDKCMTCHVAPNFQLREANPDACYDYPDPDIKIRTTAKGERYGYYLLTPIDSNGIFKFFDYMRQHKIKFVKVEIFSPGGSVMQAWRIVGLFQRFQAEGGTIETEVSGFAASAGFLIFVAGSVGHRVVAPNAELMWHEVQSFKMYDLSNPSDKEDEARVLRHFQNTANTFIASRSKMSKEDIDAAIKKKEFWIKGAEALEFGFADKVLGE